MYSLACKQLHLIDAFDIFYIFAHNSHKQQTNKQESNVTTYTYRCYYPKPNCNLAL